MTNEQAIKWLKAYIQDTPFQMEQYERAFEMAIKALSQEPCELLIIKSDILLHQDDRKKWMESIKREKESGVIILPPYFEPLLVPNDIEISIEQEPCDDAISRDAVIDMLDEMIKDRQVYFGHHGDIEWSCGFSTFKWYVEQLPSVTQKSGKWRYVAEDKYSCSKCGTTTRVDEAGIDEKPMYKFCPYCGAKMESEG